MPLDLDLRNTNSAWCSVLVETLVRCGLRHAVISPGSRSTPLTMALVRREGIEAIPVLDERSAAFFALGLAKRTGAPVLLLCTSGTAGANYMPAVIEARESGTPLLVVTADRPPEMRDCASGQTIDQQKLFGGYVQHYHEVCLPEPRLDLLRYLRQTIAHAMERTLRPQPGPVHLNMPFRDPLPPIEDGSAAGLRGTLGFDFFSHLQPVSKSKSPSQAWPLPSTVRGIIVAGPVITDDPAAYAAAVRKLADSTGWPVLADALSPVRHHAAAGPVIVAHYDAILRDGGAAQALTPRYVLCLEGWPTSKVLRAWLEQSGAEIVIATTAHVNRDSLHAGTRHILASVDAISVEGAPAANSSYRRSWDAASVLARDALVRALAGVQSEMFEPNAAMHLSQHLPAGTTVVVASSMPVRDVEYFWPCSDRGHRFIFNRGANGIDGTLSTAFGAAHANEQPTVLLTGDLAFLHDTNGMLSASRMRGSLTIVLINNNGGGIFEHLPVAQFEPPFEEFFATPQNVDFARLCTVYGVEHEIVRDWAHFRTRITSLPNAGVRVLEIRTDRKRDVVRRREVLNAAGAAAATAAR